MNMLEIFRVYYIIFIFNVIKIFSYSFFLVFELRYIFRDIFDMRFIEG